MPVTGEVHSPTISNDVAAAIQPIDTTLSNIILVAGLGILTLAWTYVLHPRLLGIQRGALLSLLEKVEEAMHERTDLEGPLLDPRSSTTMNMELSLKREKLEESVARTDYYCLDSSPWFEYPRLLWKLTISLHHCNRRARALYALVKATSEAERQRRMKAAILHEESRLVPENDLKPITQAASQSRCNSTANMTRDEPPPHQSISDETSVRFRRVTGNSIV